METNLTPIFIVLSALSYGECTHVEGVRFRRDDAKRLADECNERFAKLAEAEEGPIDRTAWVTESTVA